AVPFRPERPQEALGSPRKPVGTIAMAKHTRAPSATGTARAKPTSRSGRAGIVHTSLYLPEAVYERLREAAFREKRKIEYRSGRYQDRTAETRKAKLRLTTMGDFSSIIGEAWGKSGKQLSRGWYFDPLSPYWALILGGSTPIMGVSH